MATALILALIMGSMISVLLLIMAQIILSEDEE